ncbi:MAG: hypothetical protein PUD44_01310 [Clostridiaceae bacterium]|nr:hypothetical protein [Clostridiaceae bacterium]MDY3284966.1 hypothetical protein [Eubacteriales bacterium]MDY5015846.1 hypothetical protein [Eubacteriales bacterium]
MDRLRDHIWLWGHPEGRYNHEYGNEKESRMTPLEGILYLGGRNTFMVPVGVDVNRRQYNKSFRPLRRVGWDVTGAGQDPDVVNRLIDESREFPNIDCAVFDDFVSGGRYRDIPLENLFEVNRRLHEDGPRPLAMWMVLYTREFGLDADADAAFQPYIAPFDGVILWTWEERDIVLFEEKYARFRRMTEGKRRMFGCYLWNFGERKEATADAVRWQLDRYRELMRAGEAEGIVLHTNTMADLDYPAYDAALAWMDEHGDEPF